MRYLRIYNHHIPQKNLGHITPTEALKNWRKQRPDLFKKLVYNQSGLDSYEEDLDQFIETGKVWIDYTAG